MKKQGIFFVMMLCMVLTFCGIASATNNTQHVSLSSEGNLSNGDSIEPAVGTDGRYVTFSSISTNLVSGDNNGFSDIFIRDTLLNLTERVSISSLDTETNGNRLDPSISGDGRYVTFTSYATNLVVNDNNDHADVFVRDRILKTTTRISISNSGEEGDSDSLGSVISENGQFIVFYSYASNLVKNDNNDDYSDVFVYDLLQKTIQIVSISSNGTEGNYGSLDPAISGDGRYITFTSYADNLVVADNNGYSDIFVFDQISETTKKISSSSSGEANSDSGEPVISGDGRYIAFSSYADNLVPNDDNGVQDVFVYDQIINVMERVSLTSGGEEFTKNCHEPSINADGHYVVFTLGYRMVQMARNAFASQKSGLNYEYDGIFLHDNALGTTNLISVSSTGDLGYSNSKEPVISADGSRIVFSSYSSNLVANDNNSCSDIFINTREFSQEFSAVLRPGIAKSGDLILIKAYHPLETVNITAELFGEIKSLTKEEYGVWVLNYLINPVLDGNYPILLKSIDAQGIYETIHLNLTIDNTPPTVTGNIIPETAQFGDFIIIKAYSGLDTKRINVNICGETLKMYPDHEGTWVIDYYVPNVPDGIYPVLLTATDIAGNYGTYLLDLLVSAESFVICGSLTPETVKTFDELNISANSSSNTLSVSALILNQTYELVKQANDIWTIQYEVPYVSNGIYSVLLTATNNLGNQETYYLYFNVLNPLDNISPTINANITPNTCYLIEGIFKERPLIFVNAFTDPDTISLTASIKDVNFNLTRQEDGSWYGYYETWFQEGIYPLLLTARDWSGNLGNITLNLVIENITPTINTIIDPKRLKIGDFFNLTVFTDLDAERVYVYTTMDWDYTDLVKQADGSWTYHHVAPELFFDHEYHIWITIQYGIGWLTPDTPSLIQMRCETSVIVDSCPPGIFGFLIPEDSKSGNTLKITVQAYPSRYLTDDTYLITATVFDETFNLTKVFGDENGSVWDGNYMITPVFDGIYPVYLTGFDDLGNNRTSILYFTVDNTPPPIMATINTKILKSGDTVVVHITHHPDIQNITAEIIGENFNSPQKLEKRWGYLFRGWILNYKVPVLPDGDYNVLLNAVDALGNQRTFYLNFTVDNTPPVVTATLNPTTFKFFDFKESRKLIIAAESSLDTVNVYAIIDGVQKALRSSNGQWILEHTVPHILNVGYHAVKVIAIDLAGNPGTTYVYFNVGGFSTFQVNSGYSEVSTGGLGGSSGTNVGSGGESGGPGGSGGSDGGSGGASGGAEGGTGGTNGGSTGGSSIDLMKILMIILIACLILILVFLFAAEIIAFLWLLIGLFMGLIPIISWLIECMAIFLGNFFSALLFINPFVIILNVLALVFNPSAANALDLALTWTGAYLGIVGAPELSTLIGIVSDVTFPLLFSEVLDGIGGWLSDRKNEIIHFIKKIN
ncbi:MAG: PD40 domain-containing protein [Methanobacterium sp.]|nr:PD40 domain-containing protein [Methanobacterium sp.]